MSVLLENVLIDYFDKSLKSSMQDYSSEAQWEYAKISKIDTVDTKKAIFLTICSHQFRVFFTIHFNLEDCKEFVALGLKNKENVSSKRSNYDYLLEVSNSVCGMLKRELGNAVLALGMSTPNILENGSFNFIQDFKVKSTHFKKVKLNSKTLFYIGYYYCPNVEADIEVDIQVQEQDVDVGELELF